MQYDIDYEFKLLDGGTVELDADDIDHAESLAEKYVRDTFPEAQDILILSIRPLKDEA